MATRRGPAELAAYYSELLEEQEDSGLSVAEFAEGVGLSAATLYSWRRRLGDEGGGTKLVEVSVVDESVRSSSGSMALEVDGRFRVELVADFDECALARLLGVLDRC